MRLLQIWLFQFLVNFMQYQVAYSSSLSSSSSSSSSTYQYLCPQEQRYALLQFKHMFTIDNSSICYLSNPKTMSWNESSADRCCSWEGVTCDELTGHVIELDLSCSQLSGTFPSNSSLFQLSHLQRLNLAFNNFNYSFIPSAFGRFAGLTHLNLSSSNFGGSIPDSLMNISSLTSIDLSWTSFSGLIPHDIFHLPNLQRLLLAYNVDLTGELPLVNWSSNSSLKVLDISNTGIYGEVPDSIGYLKSLNYLNLWFTSLYGKVPDSIGYLKSLNYLDLWYTSLSGQLPYSIGYLKSLNHLDLSDTNLSGQLPNSIGYLNSLNYLDLSHTNLSGELLDSIGNLKSLNSLDLSYTNLSGELPDSIGNLKSLNSLRENSFMGQVPSTFSNLTQLTHLYLSSNNLQGNLPDDLPKLLRRLEYIYLEDNNLNGTIPSRIFTIPSLVDLDLSSNRFTGQLPHFQPKSVLDSINLSDNELHGPIPPSISNLVNLTNLDLSSSSLSGFVDLSIFSNLKNLNTLHLSNNSLSVSTINSNINSNLPNLMYFDMSSCMIEKFPYFLKTLENLYILNLSNNKIQGQIPNWFGVVGMASLSHLNISHNFITGGVENLPRKNLVTLDLHSNMLQGPLPVPPLSTQYYFISHNKLSGEIPSKICNSSSLEILDLSHNNFTSSIPPCLGYFSNYLSVLDLHSNGFQGTIPLTFAESNHLRNPN